MILSDDFPMMMEREAGMHETIPPVAVSFGLYPVIDNAKTKEAGHDVYKDVEFVKIAIPGDRNSLFFQPAQPTHRARFPQAYAAYKQRERVPVEGMRIEEWAPVSRSIALNLKAMHIDTVEALAAVHDGNVDRIGSNGRELRAKAQAWLAESKSGAAASQLATEKQALQDQLAGLQAQMAALQQQMAGKGVPAGAPAAAPIVPQVQRDPTDDVEQDVAAAARRPRKAVA
jgi:hypothetical protein